MKFVLGLLSGNRAVSSLIGSVLILLGVTACAPQRITVATSLAKVPGANLAKGMPTNQIALLLSLGDKMHFQRVDGVKLRSDYYWSVRLPAGEHAISADVRGSFAVTNKFGKMEHVTGYGRELTKSYYFKGGQVYRTRASVTFSEETPFLVWDYTIEQANDLKW